MSLGIKTADGVIPIHSVHVSVDEPVLVEKTVTANGIYAAEDDNADGYSVIDVAVDTNLTISRVPLEVGGLRVANIGDILAPNNDVDNRCRSTYAVLLDAGEYEITKSSTAAADLQINVSAYQRGQIYYSNVSYDVYVLSVTAAGYWSEIGQPFTITLSEPAYISVVVRKSDNTTLSAADAGGYVTIRKIQGA